MSALLKRETLHCGGCPHEHDKADQGLDRRELAACIALVTTLFVGVPEGCNQAHIIAAFESGLDQIVKKITGDRPVESLEPACFDDL